MLERFLKYIALETTSAPNSNVTPSSNNQFELSNLLVEDLKEIGVLDVELTKNCYVYARIPGDSRFPKIGWIAHMDTSPDFYGKCTNPQIVKYNGQPIPLTGNDALNADSFPVLNSLIGKTLITTDGTSLLGSDDKAGIVEIIEALKYIIDNNIEHGDISICFTPDEEIDRGANLFDVKKFDSDFAFTMDGGKLGELEYENFNAASSTITIEGKNIHPGSAKNMMVNATMIATEFIQLLPANERPEFTENYEGFYMVTQLKSNVNLAVIDIIIRDHDMHNFKIKKEFLEKIKLFLMDKYNTKISVDTKDSYYNMRDKIIPHMHIIELARKSMHDLNITPIENPIRGGTVGAQISYKGLPCPNLFTGGYNFHGRYEFLVLEYAELARDLIIKIIENSTKEVRK